MKTTSLWRELMVALMLSVIGAVIFAAASPIVGGHFALRMLILGLVAAYLASLLHTLHARVGRVVTMVCWLTIALLLLAFDPTLWVWLLAQVVLICLVRCLYWYDSLASAMADAALSGFAVAVALVTASHTRSVWLTLWSFFLVQALFVLIPKSHTAGATAPAAQDDSFGQAYRTAESALRRLSTRAP